MKTVKNFFGRLSKFKEINVVLFLVLLYILVGIINSSFLSANNIMLTLKSSVMYVFLAIGMSFVLLTKEIDVSVGATLGMSAAIAGTLLQSGMNAFVIIILVLLFGVLIGLINGFGVTTLKVPSIIMTLGTCGIIRGIMFVYTGGKWVENLPDYFKKASQATIGGYINVFVVIAIAVVAAVQIIMSKYEPAKYFAAIGDNIDGATLIGVKVNRVKILSFVLSGVCAAIAGLIYTSQVGFISQVAGNGLEMTTIAGCVIGGVSLNGGIGSVLGASIGAIIMTAINSALVFMKVPAYWDDTISGLLLIVIVVADALIHHYMADKNRKQRLMARTNSMGGEVTHE